MYFLALATDYDGTIAHDGAVSDATVEALAKLKRSGRTLIMVTGRELPDLERVFPHLDTFDRIVAENGALLYTPATKEARPLGPEPSQAFVDRLMSLAIEPLSVGKVIVATWEPNETVVLEVIRELGLDLQIIFNKGAVMVLPSGINKASGLDAALQDLGLSAHNVVAVGDAENDLAFMRMCGCAVAVANALPALKEEAHFVTEMPRGEGVAELVGVAIDSESMLLDAAMVRHGILLGTDDAGRKIQLRPGMGYVLISGTSGGGKSTLATGLLERMAENAFQFCVFDPEGDYTELEDAVVFGDAKTVARPDPVLAALKQLSTNVVVNMLGLDVADRPGLFAKIYPAVLEQRSTTGRPHWILVDEAHHMMPKDHRIPELTATAGEPPTIVITVHPDTLSHDVIGHLGAVICIGSEANDVLLAVAKATGRPCPSLPSRAPEQGEALYWECGTALAPTLIKVVPPKQVRKRHTRKYAEGALGEDKSFYFRGPAGALNLRAQNLMMFLQIAEGVDDETFMHHLKRGDYSVWFRSSIKDEQLADNAQEIESEASIDPAEARRRLRKAVASRYTAPA